MVKPFEHCEGVIESVKPFEHCEGVIEGVKPFEQCEGVIKGVKPFEHCKGVIESVKPFEHCEVSRRVCHGSAIFSLINFCYNFYFLRHCRNSDLKI